MKITTLGNVNAIRIVCGKHNCALKLDSMKIVVANSEQEANDGIVRIDLSEAYCPEFDLFDSDELSIEEIDAKNEELNCSNDWIIEALNIED